VRINGLEASADTLETGSIYGPGRVRGTARQVFIGGPTMTKQERARQAALARIRRAEEALKRWNADDRVRFKKWFGDDSDAARIAMLANLERMHDSSMGPRSSWVTRRRRTPT
jgi:hypothetical protein